MAYRQVVERMSAAQYTALKCALELGHWPDGRRLTEAHRDHCMAAVIHWESLHVSADQRTGYIDKGRKGQGQNHDATEVVRVLDGQPDRPLGGLE